MTTMTSEKRSALAESELTMNLLRLSKGSMSQTEATEIAKTTVKKIDWNNSALMHKGFSWIAKSILESKLEITDPV